MEDFNPNDFFSIQALQIIGLGLINCYESILTCPIFHTILNMSLNLVLFFQVDYQEYRWKEYSSLVQDMFFIDLRPATSTSFLLFLVF